MEIEGLLQKIGLSDKSAKIYLALLQLGRANVTDLAKQAGLKRPTTYLHLDELIILGFVTVIKKSSSKVYIAEHPKRIISLLDFRLKQAQDMLPDLLGIYNEPKYKPSIKTYEGPTGLKQIYNDMYAALGKKEEALFFSSISTLQTYFPQVLEDYIKTIRHKKGFRIRELLVNEHEAKIWTKKISTVKGSNHQIRLLNENLQFTGTDNLIFKNTLIIFSISKEIFALVIEHEDIAKTYRTLFNAAWLSSQQI